MGDFDRIIRENINAIFLPLVEKLLGIQISTTIDLPEKIQSTLEREPDFLKKVTSLEGNVFILHLEFQTNDESKMVYRMAEYKAMLQRKYELPVRQFVIYLGTGTPKMRTSLAPDETITGFELRNISDLPVDQVLESDIPEEIILSILSDYPRTEAESILERIIRKLQKLSKDEVTLNRYIQQLLILSRLRKLDKETKKQVNKMPITYDIETDYLFKQGIEHGVQRSVNQTITKMLLKSTMSIEEIADFTNTTVEYVQKIQSELKK